MPGAEDMKNDQTGADDKTKDQNQGEDNQSGADDQSGDDGADFSDPVKAKAEIEKLRKEAAKHRTKAKDLEGKMQDLNGKFDKLKKAFGGEDEEVDPEKMIQQLQAEKEALAIEVSISQVARAHAIPAEQDKYFRFLLAEKMEGLEEGEEITDEDVALIAAEVMKVSSKAAKNSTGVNSAGKHSGESSGETTVEAFAKMNVGEKSALYAKNPAEYNRLFSLAKEKRLI